VPQAEIDAVIELKMHNVGVTLDSNMAKQVQLTAGQWFTSNKDDVLSDLFGRVTSAHKFGSRCAVAMDRVHGVGFKHLLFSFYPFPFPLGE
jgi:hypothetical protein